MRVRTTKSRVRRARAALVILAAGLSLSAAELNSCQVSSEQLLAQDLAVLRAQQEQSNQALQETHRRLMRYQSQINGVLETFAKIFEELSLEVTKLENRAHNYSSETASAKDLQKQGERTATIFKHLIERIDQQEQQLTSYLQQRHVCRIPAYQR